MKNLLVAQSGGPTVAINSTLAGIVERAQTSEEIGRIYGALYGIQGVFQNQIIDIGEPLSNPNYLRQLMHTPSSSLGSCRIKLENSDDHPEQYRQIFRVFRQYKIGYFIYIGGNDSMDTVMKLSEYAQKNGIRDIAIMGAPKTIDNDLCGMDHSPGFGSAARYIATTFSELWCDCRTYDVPAVTIVEVMGRHVGWLTASSVLARAASQAPHLIYLPEVAFDEDHFLEDVRKKLLETHAVVIAVSEGIHYKDGSFVGTDNQPDVTDGFGHKYLSGSGKVLESLVRTRIGCKARSIDLSLMQRCAGHLASPCDLTEAKLLGATALDRALKGISGQVSAIHRIQDEPYRIAFDSVPVQEIANREKRIPREWINERGNFVEPPMLRYLTPLINGHSGSENRDGVPSYFSLY